MSFTYNPYTGVLSCRTIANKPATLNLWDYEAISPIKGGTKVAMKGGKVYELAMKTHYLQQFIDNHEKATL